MYIHRRVRCDMCVCAYMQEGGGDSGELRPGSHHEGDTLSYRTQTMQLTAPRRLLEPGGGEVDLA